MVGKLRELVFDIVLCVFETIRVKLWSAASREQQGDDMWVWSLWRKK